MAKAKLKVVETTEPLPVGPAAMLDGIFTVPFDQLVLNETNARKGHQPDLKLLANIAAHGLLMPLLVQPIGGQWSVVDGGRRYVTVKHGFETGLLSREAIDPITCRQVSDEKQALEISLSANMHQAMHPLDTCEAILELSKSEEDEKAIAAHFGQSVQWVQQRARLAQLTDKAKQAYREGRMDLGVAQLMTRLPAKDQDRLVKGKHPVYHNEVSQTLSQKGVDAKLAMFDWRLEYPADKIQPSLFDEVVLLLDVALFKEHQLKAVEAKSDELRAEGYNVVALKKDDYSTEGKFVRFEGKVKDELKPSLTYLAKPRYNGLEIEFHGPLIDRKLAAKIEKGGKGKADKTTAEPVALKATELTIAQNEILLAHIVAAVHRDILTGAASENMMRWVVIASAFGLGDFTTGSIATEHNGTDMRWKKLYESYPGEFGDDMAAGRKDLAKASTLEGFSKLSPASRDTLYCAAVAAMLNVPWANGLTKPDKLIASTGVKAERIKPGVAFFKRYRQDQLLDYLKRSGVTKSSGGMPIDGKKGTAVTVAVAKAQEKDGWRFGLE